MARLNEKSAKDLAFERERTKLHSVIRSKNDEIAKLTHDLNEYKMQAERWKRTAEILESKIGVPAEDVIADIERNKRICSFLDPLISAVGSYIK